MQLKCTQTISKQAMLIEVEIGTKEFMFLCLIEPKVSSFVTQTISKQAMLIEVETGTKEFMFLCLMEP